MQQEQTESASALAIEEKPEAAAESVKTVKAVENKIGVAIRTRGDTKVQTEPEVNYFARVMSSHRAQHLWLAFCVAPSWFLILAYCPADRSAPWLPQGIQSTSHH
jgi:hypothetical protein